MKATCQLELGKCLKHHKKTHRFFGQNHTTKKLIFQTFHCHSEINDGSTSTDLRMKIKTEVEEMTTRHCKEPQRCLGTANPASFGILDKLNQSYFLRWPKMNSEL